MKSLQELIADSVRRKPARPAPVAIAPKAVAPPVPKPTPAPTAAQVAALRQEIAAYRAGPAPKPFPGEHEHIHSDAYPPSESKVIHDHAIAMTKRDATVSYRRAVEILTARTAS
jgi:hypothetical protein